MIGKLALLLLLALPLGGCATLVGAVGAGLVAGGATWVGQEATKAEIAWAIREHKCHKLATQKYRDRCMNKLRQNQQKATK